MMEALPIELGGDGSPFDRESGPSGADEEFALECTDRGGVSAGFGMESLRPMEFWFLRWPLEELGP